MIEKLDNNEQILLMYLAGELPPEDRATVEHMLGVDEGLRRQWQEFQALQTIVSGGLERLDEFSPMPVNTDFAIRQASRAMRRQLAHPKVAPRTAAFDRPTRTWWWLYPTVAAASVVIVAMIWLNRQANQPLAIEPSYPSGAPDTSPSVQPMVNARQNLGEEDDALLLDSLSPPASSEHQEARVADEDGKQQVASGDAMPQDEISQYLLSATANGQ